METLVLSLLPNYIVFHYISDKRTDPWLLVYSPVPIVVIILLYLCVVWTGPRFMKHRGPVDLKGVLLLYNFAMVCLSGYMFQKVCMLFLVSCTFIKRVVMLIISICFLSAVEHSFFYFSQHLPVCLQFVVLSRSMNYSFLCQPVDYSNSPLAMKVGHVKVEPNVLFGDI